MKKADNFDASKWLVENKITFQSRLNEDEEKRGFYVTMKPKDGSYGKSTLTNLPNHANQTYHGALSSIERLKDINGKKGKKYAYYVSDKDGNPLDKDGNIINEESRLNENKTLGPDDFDTFKWKNQPSNPNAKLEDLENEDTVSKGDFWKSDIIGNDSSTPTYGSENNGVWTFAWESGEISGFIEGEDFTLNTLNEEEYSSERINQRDVEIAGGEVINHTFDTIDMIDLDNGYKVKVLSTYYFRDPGVKGYSDTNSEENPMISGVKTTLIDPSGKPIKNHNFTGSGQWWMLTSGKKYFMPQIKAWWEDKIGRLGLSESKLNEDLTDEIAALPDFNSAMDREKSELIVGKYAVVRYDESDEGGENMYVVWDNTVNQDEIGSYDDVPEFESEDPAEVANWLKQNA